MQVPSQQKETQSIKPPSCENPQHKNKRLKLWCSSTECLKGICVLCSVEHNGHKMVFPEDVKNEQFNTIQKLRDHLQQLQDKQFSSKQKLAQYAEEAKTYKEQTLQKLEEDIESLKSYLDQLKESLITQFNDLFYNEMVSVVEDLNQAFDQHNSKLQKAIDEVDNFIQLEKSDVEKVSFYIAQKLEQKTQIVVNDQTSKVEFLYSQIENYKSSFPLFKLFDTSKEELGKMVVTSLMSNEFLKNVKNNCQKNAPQNLPPELTPSRVEWNQNRKSKHMELSQNNQTVTKSKSYFGWASALTNQVITKGEVFIEFQIVSAGKSGFSDLYIGLLKNDPKINLEDECLNGYGSCTVWALNRNGDFYEPTKGCITTDKESKKYDTGDVVSILINAKRKEAVFSVGELECLKINDIGPAVIPYVCMGGNNQSVSISNFYTSGI